MSLAERQAPVAPEPARLIEWLVSEPAVRDRGLSDGRLDVPYARLLRLLERLDRHLDRQGASRQQPVALECSQSVVGAVALLHLLARGYEVVLLPDLGGASKEAGTPRFVPSFCSHVLTASPAPEGLDDEEAVERVAVAAHEGFQEEPLVSCPAEGPNLYLRTSGSTGTPKLARMSHRRWLNNAVACVDRWGLRTEDRLSLPVPIFHSYGFGAAFLPGLLVGASMDLGSGGNLLRYLEREEVFRPDVAFLTPALADAFVSVRKSPRRYRLSVTAGDKVKPETVRDFEPRFGPLLDLYGSAEMGAVSSPAPADPLDRRLGTAGRPLAGVELRVEGGGPEVGARAEEATGALQVRRADGFTGYLVQERDGWRLEPRTDDQWFDTGDLATLHPDGRVRIRGRARLSVKRDGLLVVFADVEAAVGTIPGIRRAVVAAAGEGSRGARLVAVCEADAGTAPPPAAVRRRCFDLLPRYAVPDEVLVVDSLPQLPSGKVDRRGAAALVPPVARAAPPRRRGGSEPRAPG